MYFGERKVIDKEDIFSLNQLQVYQVFSGLPLVIGKRYSSPLPRHKPDKNPSFNLYTHQGKVLFKDFGTGVSGNCIDFVSLMLGISFSDACLAIAERFGIVDSQSYFESRIEPVKSVEIKPKIDVVITPIHREFITKDLEYWNKFGIGVNILDRYGVKACKSVYATKDGSYYLWKKEVFEDSEDLIFSYLYVEDNQPYYQIYCPNSEKKYKWLSNTKKNFIKGVDNLCRNDVLFISKGYKDVMVYRSLGYDAICFHSESCFPDIELVTEIGNKYENVIILYDNDEAGIKLSGKLSELLGYITTKIPIYSNTKDIAEFRDTYGKEETIELIEGLIKDLKL